MIEEKDIPVSEQTEDTKKIGRKRIAISTQENPSAMHGGYVQNVAKHSEQRMMDRRNKQQLYRQLRNSIMPTEEDTSSNQASMDNQLSPVRNNTRRRVRQKKSTKMSDTIKIIPLGGLEEIGLNITAFEYRDSIIIVDCGIAFPDEDAPGVDLIIPDVSYLKQNINKVKAMFITHGHEDHIGAIPYVMEELGYPKFPVYGTRLTLAIIQNKLEQHKAQNKVKMVLASFGEANAIMAGSFSVEFIKTNHSIQDSASLAIRTDSGTIIHTGDFKIDHTPVFGDTIDLARFAQLGQEGVLALLCDSTNAGKEGSVMSEKHVGKILDDLFLKYKEKRILIATFASNVDRVQQIINAAHKTGKKVVIEGRSMVTIMDIAIKLGYVTLPDNTVIDIDEMNNYAAEDVAIIMTGSQGEQMSALTKVSRKKHTKIQAGLNDVVIFSSHPIPGNEKAVNEVINNFMMDGIEVVLQDVHVSGHACADDIKLMYSLIKPTFSVPVHGDFRQRTAQAGIAASLGYEHEFIKLIRSGDVLELCDNHAEVTSSVPVGKVMVDGGGIGNIGNIVLKERKQLSTEGIVMITVVFDEQTGMVLSGPEIICRGFIYMRESRHLIFRIKKLTESIIEKDTTKSNPVTWEVLKEHIKVSLGDFLWDELKAKPIILPVFMEV